MTRAPFRHGLGRAWLLGAALGGAAAAPGCGGRQPSDAVGGEELLTRGRNLMGPVEERARNHVFDMATILDANLESPDVALDRMRSLFSVNGARMFDDAQALSERYAAVEEQDRRRYEAQLAAYLDESWIAWRDAMNRFTAAHPDVARAIAELVELADRTPEARARLGP